MAKITVADLIAQSCAMQGVARVFGVPGGGSSLDLIEAFQRHNIDFHVCRTETGAALMAAADAEIRHSFGVVIVTQGPGTASAMNGVAYSALDRAPVLLITDGWTVERKLYDTHQVFDQRQMSSAVVKAHSRLESSDPAQELSAMLQRMQTAPWGPAHIELTSENARRVIDVPSEIDDRDLATSNAYRAGDLHSPAQATSTPITQQHTEHGDVAALLSRARKPVMLVGLECREKGVPQRIVKMAEQLRCPILTTYKAKGLVADTHTQVVGHITGGAAEQPCVRAADLIILCGFDPIELIGKPWPYDAPVLDVSLVKHPVHYVVAQAGRYGALADNLDQLLPLCQSSAWTLEEMHRLRDDMKVCLRYERNALTPSQAKRGVSPQYLVETAMHVFDPAHTAISVDAGAHMFSVMAFWRAYTPSSVLISNGLSTMGLALPAGIARGLHSPHERTLVFTGDGGLMMCAGELATAAQANVNLCVVVFNDAALSLIALKQRDRGMEDRGVTWPKADFASLARGFGVSAFRAENETEYENALREVQRTKGPCLIDVHVDPSGYRAQAKRLRG